MANQVSNTSRLRYTLQLADNELIIGHRLSEWCGHGPILEQDIALTNTSLDHLGGARSLYQYAAQQFNELPASEKITVFTSVALQKMATEGQQIDEDDLAYLRDGWDFRNTLLAEQPNGDWAYTVARSFYLDTFNYFFFSELQKSSDESLAAVAEKSLKEVTYHMRWSSEWVIRLGDGTDESHERMQNAINELWSFTGELFIPSTADKAMHDAGLAPDVTALKAAWDQRINTILDEATLTVPTGTWMQQGGKEGLHSEHLGYILAEMQYMQRTYPGMEW